MALPVAQNILEQQRQQIIHYFTQQIAATPARRDRLWQPNFSSVNNYEASLQTHRDHLRKMLGLIRPSLGTPQIRILQQSKDLQIEDVTIQIDSNLRARALLFLPHSTTPEPAVIAIPPANERREEFTGIVQGMMPAKWVTTLLDREIAVVVPITVERRDDHPLCQAAGGKDCRRILWRAGFIIGRTLVGVEVQQVLALREYLSSQRAIDPKRILVFGERQGGMTALYAGAIDSGFAGTAIVNYFQQREDCWKEPVDRVLYGQLNEFGDAEVAALIAPRPLLIVTTSGGPVAFSRVKPEAARAHRFYQGLKAPNKLVAIEVPEDALQVTALKLATLAGASSGGNLPELTLRITRSKADASRNEHFEMLYSYLRGLDAESDKVRKNYWQLYSTPPQDRPRKATELRASLSHLMGVIPSETIPMRPRTALIGETDKFLAYDVFLDVMPGVQAYGQLLIPREVAGHTDKRLPAMICQHGFDGAPKYVTGVGNGLESNDHFYHRFGERLAERGYVVFAPYLTVPEDPDPPGIVHRADLINPLVRLAACLGMMRTSIELAKLHRIVDFLQSLPFVDADRIGYYGLSYGGYSAMWMPPLEPRLRFTIISAYFNDWSRMLTDTTRVGDSYWSLPDEDFYNWNVLNRFTHTELIAAMWPRPVCVEWGLNDPVTPPAWHRQAWEEVKEFANSWGLDDKIVDDDFIGPHTIHGIGTFFFIDRWLRPERSAGRDYGCFDYNYCNETVAPAFHGYSLSSLKIVPYVTQLLDSNRDSAIQGKFYVSDVSTMFIGMAFKMSRMGNPGDLIASFGSREGADDVGQARVLAKDVYPHLDLWYTALLKKPVRLDPGKIYFFEIKAQLGRTPENYFTVFGPKPLGGKDYPPSFGLSFHVLTRSNE
ncbi:MAG: prolyl oligopeptidase family serine peptidase [Terriglobia bacterium]